MAHRAIPVPTVETAPFWDAASAGRLRLPQCVECGLYLYPPPPRCPDCPQAALVWGELSGEAKIMSWTRVHIDGPGGLRAPFAIVNAELDEAPGTMVVANLPGAPDRLEIGLPLILRFAPIEGTPLAIPEFTLSKVSQ